MVKKILILDGIRCRYSLLVIFYRLKCPDVTQCLLPFAQVDVGDSLLHQVYVA